MDAQQALDLLTPIPAKEDCVMWAADVLKIRTDLKFTEITIDEVVFTIYDDGKGKILDRVFIPVDKRGKGSLSPALNKFVEIADRNEWDLFTTVLPDSNSDTDYAILRHVFNKAGFTPDAEYRNDLTRTHKNS